MTGRQALLLLTLAGALGLAGCAAVSSTPGYYWQAALGQARILVRAEPIDRLLAEPATDPTLRAQLERALAIRRFAVVELGLPDNASYTRYADLGRAQVVWNVFAAPEFSTRLEQWCFPVAGCVAYRGYFDRQSAERFAQGLRGRGLEVHVAGIAAYSTLGWLRDPVLNTFIHYPEADLARLIFHELAHQQVYVPGDTVFNESFATLVEEVGLERWLARRGLEGLARQQAERSRLRREFVELLGSFRERLDQAYAVEASDDDKRRLKAQILAEIEPAYRARREAWGGFSGFDRWFDQPVNNARLASLALYHGDLPAFRALLAEQGGDLRAFYREVQQLALLGSPERRARLQDLLRAGAT